MATFISKEYGRHSVDALGGRWRDERRPCNFPAMASVDHREFHCTIINLSIGGIGFTVDPVIKLHVGNRIVVTSPEIGSQPCVVRWGANTRYGATFDSGDRPPAGIAALYDSLPPESEH